MRSATVIVKSEIAPQCAGGCEEEINLLVQICVIQIHPILLGMGFNKSLEKLSLRPNSRPTFKLEITFKGLKTVINKFQQIEFLYFKYFEGLKVCGNFIALAEFTIIEELVSYLERQ